MFIEASLFVAEPRPRAWRQRSGNKVAKGPHPRARSTSAQSAPPPTKKGAGRRVAAAARVPRAPEGWHSRLREQSHNLARAIEMLEQAMAMMSEPKSISLTRA